MRYSPNVAPRNDALSREQRILLAPVSVLIISVVFYWFPGFMRLFAWPWVIGRNDVLGWWPVLGHSFWYGIGAVVLTTLIPAWCYSVGKSNRTILTVWAICATITLGLLFWGGRSRIEVRAHDIRVTSDRWGEADALYRVDNAAGMIAACWIGSKGHANPSLWVWFHDGRELELERLTSRDANPGATRAGLDFAEQLDTFLAQHGNRRSERIEDRCVEWMEDRLDPTDAPRIGALFAREMIPIEPAVVPGSSDAPVIDMTPR
ncbi:MAG: hypothetical protein EBR82_02320 [Caulobacteraceae bacterium]|nr:hypothetical protein [Caulobacteraceae bacterium]